MLRVSFVLGLGFSFFIPFGGCWVVITCMDSDANDLNSRNRLRWGDNHKVYTRKRRRTLENTSTDVAPAATAAVSSAAAAPEVISNSGRDTNENDEVPEPSLQTQFRDCSIVKGVIGGEQVALSNGGEVRELTEDSCGRDEPRDGGAGLLVEHKAGESADGSFGRDVPEVGRGIDTGAAAASSGGEVPEGSSGSQPAMQNHRDEPQSDNLEMENGYGKPVISRIQDRIRINLTGVRSSDEIRELGMSLESELDQVRGLVKQL